MTAVPTQDLAKQLTSVFMVPLELMTDVQPQARLHLRIECKVRGRRRESECVEHDPAFPQRAHEPDIRLAPMRGAVWCVFWKETRGSDELKRKRFGCADRDITGFEKVVADHAGMRLAREHVAIRKIIGQQPSHFHAAVEADVAADVRAEQWQMSLRC